MMEAHQGQHLIANGEALHVRLGVSFVDVGDALLPAPAVEGAAGQGLQW